MSDNAPDPVFDDLRAAVDAVLTKYPHVRSVALCLDYAGDGNDRGRPRVLLNAKPPITPDIVYGHLTAAAALLRDMQLRAADWNKAAAAMLTDVHQKVRNAYTRGNTGAVDPAAENPG